VSCSTAPTFPTDKIIEYDSKNKVCGLYKIVNFESYQVEYVKDIPCPDVFGFDSHDVPNVMNWLRDMKKYAETRCK
jgi:hypothetical protein